MSYRHPFLIACCVLLSACGAQAAVIVPTPSAPSVLTIPGSTGSVSRIEIPGSTPSLRSSDVSGITETPIASDVSGITETLPIVPSSGGTSGAPIVSDVSGITEIPIASDVSSITETPIASDVSGITETPIALEAPALTDTPVLTDTPIPSSVAVMDDPVRLVIAAIGLDQKLASVGLDSQYVPIVPNHEAGWYNLSARPGQGENIVLWGHVLRFTSTPDIPAPFARIKDLEVGAEVILYDTAGAARRYTVTSHVWATPDQVQYILPQGREMLTMVSCIGDKVIVDDGVEMTHRLITIAEPVGD